MSFITGTQVETIYRSLLSSAAKNTFTTEVQINDTATMGDQAVLPKGFFRAGETGQTIQIKARGRISCTGTPTFTWTIRGGAAGSITSAILLGSAALTCLTTITNKLWEIEGEFSLRTHAAGAASTIEGGGILTCPAGLASPGAYEVWGGGTQPGTATTFDCTIDNFINLNVACSASSGSNQVQIDQLLVLGLN